MSREEVKKVSVLPWEEKVHRYHLPMHYAANLQEVEDVLGDIEETLREGGMEGLGYQKQEEQITEVGAGIGYLNAYIDSLAAEIDLQIDRPLYEGFQNDATEQLSRIKMENYTTENTLQLKTHHVLTDGYGKPIEYDGIEPSLTMADFLGLTSLGEGTKERQLVGMPEEFKNFTNLFALEYDTIKENLRDANGNPVSLEDYLETLNAYGEFDNKMDKPVLEFVSGLLDVTIVKPLIEMCTGYDLITGEDLSEFERGMKGVFATVDVVTLLVGIKASGAVKLFSKEALQFTGKTMALGILSTGAAYGVGQAGEELGLPLPVTLLLSLGAGITVAKVGGKYIFRDGTGKQVLEAGADEVDALSKTGEGDNSFSELMSPEDAAKYNQWMDLKDAEFSAEELYNLEKFGSIKTSLDYTTTSGLKIQATPGKTTTILGTYNGDTKHIVNELGNIKSTDFGAADGGFNLLNTPDELYITPEQFWNEYNKPWLDSVIEREDIIKIATEPTYTTLYRFDKSMGKDVLTGFGREIKYLEKSGYVYDSFTKSMIK